MEAASSWQAAKKVFFVRLSRKRGKDQRPGAAVPLNCHQGASTKLPLSQSLSWCCCILCFVGGKGEAHYSRTEESCMCRYTRLDTAGCYWPRANSRKQDGRKVHPRAQNVFWRTSYSDVIDKPHECIFLPKLRLKCTFMIRYWTFKAGKLNFNHFFPQATSSLTLINFNAHTGEL